VKHLRIFLKISIILFFFFSCIYLLYFINNNKNLFQEVVNKERYKEKFDQSQWIITNKNKNVISDADLYTHIGIEYIKGVDPTTQNFEIPPLGKYLIGSSVVIFFNQRIFSLIFALFCLLLIFYLVYINTHSIFPSLLATSLTMTSWFFLDQIVNAPQMEIFQLFFLLCLFLFFSLYEKKTKKRYLILAGLSAGGFLSIKFFFVHYFLLMIMFTSYYFISKKKLRKILIDLSVINLFIFLIYVGYYYRFFLLGESVIEFLQIQKWIIGFYLKSGIETAKIFAGYLPLIYANRWQFWSKGYPIIHYDYWSITWPIIHSAGIMSLIFLYTKKYMQKNPFYKLLAIFIIIYSIFLLFTPIWPRYLLLLFVPLQMVISLFII